MTSIVRIIIIFKLHIIGNQCHIENDILIDSDDHSTPHN